MCNNHPKDSKIIYTPKAINLDTLPPGINSKIKHMWQAYVRNFIQIKSDSFHEEITVPPMHNRYMHVKL